MDKPDILIVGAGLMGRAAAYFFLHHPEGPFKVLLADNDEQTLEATEKWLGSAANHSDYVRLDVNRSDSVLRALTGTKLCLSCVPYFLGPKLAHACLHTGTHYLDLGGNPEVTDKILALDENAKRHNVVFIPDTGLAPGLVNILAWELVGRFKRCEEVRLYVGGLPQVPSGPLKYTQFFSIHGLVNEYFEDARELRGGVEVTVPSLSDLEAIEFPGVGQYEAFVTSGGTSTLTRTLADRVQRLNYKTIRYPGHAQALQFLRDLGLTEPTAYKFDGCEVSPRRMLVRVLETTLPKGVADVLLLRAIAKGEAGREEKIELVVKYDKKKEMTALELMTAFPAAAIALAILKGKVPAGAHAQEKVIPFSWMQSQLALFGVSLK